jgi:hypothetical protein
VASLIDHVVIEILRCLPTCSLCCCKYVCRSWNRLTSDSNNRKVLPQTVASFCYDSWNGKQHFTSVTGERPSLSFLPFPMDNVTILDSYKGLILCWCIGAAEYRYVVYNPKTQNWKVLPPSIHSVGEARLRFNLIVSSHFV